MLGPKASGIFPVPHASGGGGLNPVGKWKERIGGKNRTASPGARLLDRALHRVDAAHLPSPDSDRAARAVGLGREHDRVALGVLGHLPREGKRGALDALEGPRARTATTGAPPGGGL